MRRLVVVVVLCWLGASGVAHAGPLTPVIADGEVVARVQAGWLRAEVAESWGAAGWAEAVSRAVEAADGYIEAGRQAEALRSTYRAPVVVSQPVNTSGLGNCGGAYPPCYVKARESGGSYSAQNPSSSASGAWQFLDSTWNGYGGYARAADAPASVQDAKAAEVWAGGAGCSAWSAC